MQMNIVAPNVESEERLLQIISLAVIASIMRSTISEM